MTTRTLPLGTLIALLTVNPVHAGNPSIACELGKVKASAKHFACLLQADAVGITKSSSPDYSRCESSVDKSWAKAEVRGEGMCPAGDDDQVAVDAFLTACEQAVTGVLSGASQFPILGGVSRSFTDNGDGTITDDVTGLTWEKLTDDGTIHDRDDKYTWFDATDVKMATLNGMSFGGHNDWRLPDRFELATLGIPINAEHRLSMYPAFDTECPPGCTNATCSCTTHYLDYYWTSTTYAGDSAQAWSMEFFSALNLPSFGPKTFSAPVRAVRGGS